jgi:hypothetical protein
MVALRSRILQGPNSGGSLCPFRSSHNNAGIGGMLATYVTARGPPSSRSPRQRAFPDRSEPVMAIIGSKSPFPLVAMSTGLALALTLTADPAMAYELHGEPSNALSLPTWAVHTSSVIEWVTAMGLMWKYAQVSGNSTWKGMTWGMMPCMGSALCACTWHFFYNASELEVSGINTCGFRFHAISYFSNSLTK